jgi:ElaB/YqjD/DUF883 family membrane-anchored ribosome-binding protein
MSAVEGLLSRSEDLAHRSLGEVRERTRHARDVTTDYIRHEPMKSVLVAVALGAALVALAALLSRNGESRRY